MNIMLLSPNADDLAQLAIDEKIEVLTTGAGNPGKYIADWKNAGIKIMPVVASVALAKRMERPAQMRLSQKAWRAAAISVS